MKRHGHSMPIRIYYEDTDFSGVVYHASYLRFLERGRTEFLRAAGVDHRTLFSEEPPRVLVVRRMEIDFVKPALMDDMVSVETERESMTGATVILSQKIRRGGELLLSAVVTIVCVAKGRAVRLPASVRSALLA
jgi:acyl-CoA thioester hydrolase